MKLEICSDSRDSAILVCDEHHNDIAEFFHSDHATVSQSYDTALALARALIVSASALSRPQRATPSAPDVSTPVPGRPG